MQVARMLALASLTTLAAMLPPSLSAQNVAGRWVLSVELDAGGGDATFELSVDGNQITGTYTGALGEADVTGTIDGNAVTLGFTVDQVGDISYEGTVDGDTMSGTVEYGMLGAGTFSGTRRSG